MIEIVDKFILVGTSHVAKNSVKEIENAIEQYMPQVVGIELDAQRFKKIMSQKENDKEKKANQSTIKAIKELGAFGFLFAQLAGFVQKKVGKSINIDPGVDMKGAYLKAREKNIPVSLIDLHINLTLKKMSNLSFTKKIKLVSSLFFKSFKKEYKQLLNFDLNSVPDDETVIKMIGILKKETPELYKILIEDRNKHMCKKLIQLKENHEGNIMAVVGAGHVEGMKKILLEHLKITTIPTITFSYHATVDEDSL